MIKEKFKVVYYEVDGFKYLDKGEMEWWSEGLIGNGHLGVDLDYLEEENETPKIVNQLKAFGFTQEDDVRIIVR